MNTFMFRISLELANSVTIGCDKETLEIARLNESSVITLHSDEDEAKEIKDSSCLIVTGKHFASEQEATSQGQACMQALILALTRVRIGADFGAIQTAWNPLPPVQAIGPNALHKVPGLMVYDATPPKTLLWATATDRMSRGSDYLLRCFQTALDRAPVLSEKERIALELFHSYFFEHSVRARFVMLVTAIEALLTCKIRRKEALGHVGDLITATEQSDVLTPEERVSMLGSLRRIQQDSIKQTGRAYVSERLGQRTYLDKQPATFFGMCYDARSMIVHEGVSNSSGIPLATLCSHLEGFVSDLLCVSLLDIVP